MVDWAKSLLHKHKVPSVTAKTLAFRLHTSYYYFQMPSAVAQNFLQQASLVPFRTLSFCTDLNWLYI